MILFTILAIMAIIAAVIAIVVVGTLGGATIVVFGDALIFIGIVYLIVKFVFRKKK